MIIDPKIVSLAIEGNKDSFTALYNSTYKDFYKYALYILGNQEEAMDAVSDAYLDIWKEIHSLKDPSSFPAWGMRILSIKCKRQISQLITNRNNYNLDDYIETPSESLGALDETLSEGSSLSDALSKIDPSDRMIIFLSVLYGYKNKEISEMLDMPPGTVSSRLFRAYDKLRNILGGE